jgi:hypothetical protein
MQELPQPGGVIPSSAQLINQLLGVPPVIPPSLSNIVQLFQVLAIQFEVQPLLKLSVQIVTCDITGNEKKIVIIVTINLVVNQVLKL